MSFYKNFKKGIKDMKKIFFVLPAVVFTASLCFAQESERSSALASQSALPVSQVESKSFTGKVNVVSVGNVNEGVKSQITVMDDNGQSLGFALESGALITDKDGNILTLTDIKNDTKITVTYITEADGTNKAQAIKVSEQPSGV